MTYGNLSQALQLYGVDAMFKVPVSMGSMREIRQNNRDEIERLSKHLREESKAILAEAGLAEDDQDKIAAAEKMMDALSPAQIESLDDEQRERIGKLRVYREKIKALHDTEIKSNAIQPMWTWDDITITTTGDEELALKLLGLVRAKDTPAPKLRKEKTGGAAGKRR